MRVASPVSTASAPASVGGVFALVRTEAAVTRGALGEVTGLSRSALGARLSTLLDRGLLVEGPGDERPLGAGRPPVVLRVNPRAGVVLAAAIGRSRTQLAICDLTGALLAGGELDQEPGVDPDELMPRVLDHFVSLAAAAEVQVADVRAVGITLPGTVDFQRGVSVDSPLMPGWHQVDLTGYLRAAWGDALPVVVDNDCNGLAMSERRGALETHDNLLLLKASTGIGVGIVADGSLVRGAHGAAGELGHVKSRHADGRGCRCGATGCLEAVAGGWALVEELRAKGRQVTHLRDVVALAGEGDVVARAAVRESGRRVGEVLAGAVNLLNPDAVVVGGDMVGAYDLFVAGLRESVYAEAAAVATRRLEILPATHGDRSGVVGCAALALDEVLSARAVDRWLSVG